MATSDGGGGDNCADQNTNEERHAPSGSFVRGADGPLDLDTVFRLLAVQRRRMILRLFHHRAEDRAELREVVEFVHWWEHELGKSPLTDREAIEIDLRHRHLPVFTAANAIEYDETDETIHYRAPDRLERFLELAIEESVLP